MLCTRRGGAMQTQHWTSRAGRIMFRVSAAIVPRRERENPMSTWTIYWAVRQRGGRYDAYRIRATGRAALTGLRNLRNSPDVADIEVYRE